MAELSPNPAVTKFGSLLIILLVALLAVWLVNNVLFVNKLVQKRTA